MSASPDRVRLELRGERAVEGIELSSLEGFIENFRQALVDFDRHRRAEETKRSGHPNVREQLVASFRVLELKKGSALLTLAPEAAADLDGDQDRIEAEALPIEVLSAMLTEIEDEHAPVSDAVTDRLSKARAALGPSGTITVVVEAAHRPKKRVVIDEDRIDRLERRQAPRPARGVRVSGRMHALATEPDRVEIRSPNGVNWICRYPPQLEDEVARLITKSVWARGLGIQQSSQRGTLDLVEIHPLAEFEQTALFSFERIPLEQLMRDIHPHGRVPAPETVTDDDLDAFLSALDEI